MSIADDLSHLITRAPFKPFQKPVRIFEKPKYLCHKLESSLQHKSRFDPIEELYNENSQISIKEIDITEQQKDNNNIFINELNDNADYSDKFIGPRFDSSGNLIKYSIIGKPDRFLRKYNQTAELRKSGYDSKASLIYSPKNSSFSCVEWDSSLSKPVENSFRRKSRSKKTTFIHASTIISNVNKAVQKRNLTRLNKNQVFNEIRKVEDRIRMNSLNDNVLLQGLSRNDQLFMSKEQRIFKKQEKNELEWENQLNILKHKVPRAKSEHLIKTSGEFRYKKEKANIMDLLKTDHEKYGNKYWYHSIRQNLDNELKAMGTEIPKVFSQSQLNFKNNQIEYLRGLNNIKNKNGSYSQNVINLINLRGNLKDDYLRKKLIENKRKIDIIQPANTVEASLYGFEVNSINFHYGYYIMFIL